MRNTPLKIKVCGMKYCDNIQEVVQLPIDYLGFIFYEKSSRYVGDMNLSDCDIPLHIAKTGVFVNETVERMNACIEKYRLDAVQLHGSEKPDLCREMRKSGVQIIKVFSIKGKEDLALCEHYSDVCDYFLFDTKTSKHGGSGVKFDWDILLHYRGKTPFFLSGGIGAEDAEYIRSFAHPACYGVDVNSRFETQLALKNIALLKQFIQTLKSEL